MRYRSKSNQTTFGTSIKEEYFERAADYWEKETIVFSASQKNRGKAT